MATTTNEEWHPHIGSIWQRVQALWAQYVVDTTLTWELAQVTISSMRCCQVTIAGASDTTVWNLVDSSCFLNQLLPVQHVANLPGWMTPPPVVEETYGARNALNDWLDNVAEKRRTVLWPGWCNSNSDSRYESSWNLLFTGASVYQAYWSVYRANEAVVDTVALFRAAQTATKYYYGGQPPNPAVAAPPPGVIAVGGGGGSVDLTALIACLNGLYAAGPAPTLASMLSAIDAIAHTSFKVLNRDGRVAIEVIGGSVIAGET